MADGSPAPGREGAFSGGLAAPVEIAFEQLANPHFLLLHFRTVLTDEMAEKYSRSSASATPHWIRGAFGYQTISDVHLMRYRLRFRTYRKRYDWQPFIDFLSTDLLPRSLGKVVHRPLPAGKLRRTFVVREAFDNLTVIEGLAASLGHPLMAKLFRIPGVAEIKGQGHALTIKRAALYGWGEIEAQLPGTLEPQERS